MNKILDINYLDCPGCRAPLPAPQDSDPSWLSGLSSPCPACYRPVNWWSLVSDLLQHPMPTFRHGAVALLGGHVLVFPILMRPGEVHKLDFRQYGVDDDSLILHKNYTGESPVWPLEIHGNEPIRSRHAKVVHLYGRARDEADLAIPLRHRKLSRINVYIAYVPQQPGRHTSMTLARAYEEFIDQNFPEMLIPASVAVEDEVKRLAAECLAREGLPNPQSRNRELLLDSILPLYCKANSQPWLPLQVREKIRRLWGLRDGMAHHGRLDAPLADSDAAGLLAAAILAVRFVQAFRVQLTGTGAT